MRNQLVSAALLSAVALSPLASGAVIKRQDSGITWDSSSNNAPANFDSGAASGSSPQASFAIVNREDGATTSTARRSRRPSRTPYTQQPIPTAYSTASSAVASSAPASSIPASSTAVQSPLPYYDPGTPTVVSSSTPIIWSVKKGRSEPYWDPNKPYRFPPHKAEPKPETPQATQGTVSVTISDPSTFSSGISSGSISSSDVTFDESNGNRQTASAGSSSSSSSTANQGDASQPQVPGSFGITEPGFQVSSQINPSSSTTFDPVEVKRDDASKPKPTFGGSLNGGSVTAVNGGSTTTIYPADGGKPYVVSSAKGSAPKKSKTSTIAKQPKPTFGGSLGNAGGVTGGVTGTVSSSGITWNKAKRDDASKPKKSKTSTIAKQPKPTFGGSLGNAGGVTGGVTGTVSSSGITWNKAKRDDASKPKKSKTSTIAKQPKPTFGGSLGNAGGVTGGVTGTVSSSGITWSKAKRDDASKPKSSKSSSTTKPTRTPTPSAKSTSKSTPSKPKPTGTGVQQTIPTTSSTTTFPGNSGTISDNSGSASIGDSSISFSSKRSEATNPKSPSNSGGNVISTIESSITTFSPANGGKSTTVNNPISQRDDGSDSEEPESTFGAALPNAEIESELEPGTVTFSPAKRTEASTPVQTLNIGSSALTFYPGSGGKPITASAGSASSGSSSAIAWSA